LPCGGTIEINDLAGFELSLRRSFAQKGFT
jgi:hypothetical protein